MHIQESLPLIILKETFIKSILLASFESVYYCRNKEEFMFIKVAEKKILDLDTYDFWKILNPLTNLIAIMDNKILYHLYEIERFLISYYLWNNSPKFKKEYLQFINTKDFEGKYLIFKILDIESCENLGVNSINFKYDKNKYGKNELNKAKSYRLTETNNQTLFFNL